MSGAGTYHGHKDCPNGERANNCRPQQRDDVNEEEGADELHQVRCNVHHGGCAGLLLVNHAAGRNARHQCLRCGHAMLRGVATAGKPHLAEPIIIRKVGVHGARLVVSANAGRMEDERSESARARASHKLGVRDAAFCCLAIRTDDWTASRPFECVMTNTIVTTLRIRWRSRSIAVRIVLGQAHLRLNQQRCYHGPVRNDREQRGARQGKGLVPRRSGHRTCSRLGVFVWRMRDIVDAVGQAPPRISRRRDHMSQVAVHGAGSHLQGRCGCVYRPARQCPVRAAPTAVSTCAVSLTRE